MTLLHFLSFFFFGPKRTVAQLFSAKILGHSNLVQKYRGAHYLEQKILGHSYLVPNNNTVAQGCSAKKMEHSSLE